jgi:signal transduction histidine kinase
MASSSQRSPTTGAAARARPAARACGGLADRLEAIGGSLELESPPGGTVVRALVPVGSSQEETALAR